MKSGTSDIVHELLLCLSFFFIFLSLLEARRCCFSFLNCLPFFYVRLFWSCYISFMVLGWLHWYGTVHFVLIFVAVLFSLLFASFSWLTWICRRLLSNMTFEFTIYFWFLAMLLGSSKSVAAPVSDSRHNFVGFGTHLPILLKNASNIW